VFVIPNVLGGQINGGSFMVDLGFAFPSLVSFYVSLCLSFMLLPRKIKKV